MDFSEHEDKESFDWLMHQIKQGLAEADEPNVQWISNEDARASWAKKRTVLLSKLDSGVD
ncbi:hypothetical protein [Herbaspirillum seropedicae]|uniref:hypothetical protein n=1 Tax=Herbaspirillum seropedicae TaxID=964 RepID=UPI000847E00D|nr:hypothetical protein [Herbaspirillum seropedicae]